MVSKFAKHVIVPKGLQINDAFTPIVPLCLQAPFPALKQVFPFLNVFERRIPRPLHASLHSFASLTSDPSVHCLIPCSCK